MFNQPLRELDYQYLGLFAILCLVAISIYLRTDFITGFLTATGVAMVRHLYRNSSKHKEAV